MALWIELLINSIKLSNHYNTISSRYIYNFYNSYCSHWTKCAFYIRKKEKGLTYEHATYFWQKSMSIITYVNVFMCAILLHNGVQGQSDFRANVMIKISSMRNFLQNGTYIFFKSWFALIRTFSRKKSIRVCNERKNLYIWFDHKT